MQPQLPFRGKEGTEETRELFSHAWNSAPDLVMLSPKPYGNSGVSPGLFPQPVSYTHLTLPTILRV